MYVNAVAPEPGTYSLSCVCSTEPTVGLDLTPGAVNNTSYNPATGVFTANVNVVSQGTPGGPGQFVLTFKNTSGTLTDLQLIRPGYSTTDPPIFTNDYLASLQQGNPTVLRFMDWDQTNGNVTSNWSDRTLTTDATQTQYMTATVNYGFGSTTVTDQKGVAWEYMIDLANTLHTDMWINIPSLATNDYITQLATLIKDNLDPDLNVYVEYSNEVWNGQFIQTGMNTVAAEAQVAGGGSNLNYDGATNPTQLSDRLIAQKLVDVSQIFGSVFGSGAIDTRVRPVLAYELGQDYSFSDMLNYVAANYGAPKNYFYSLAVAPYFSLGAEDSNSNLSTNEVLEGLAAAAQSYATNGVIAGDVAEAGEFGLKLNAYEAGPDTFGSNNIAAKEAANQSPQMQTIITNFLDTWYRQGGGLINYFALGASSFDSQYGTWSISDNIDDLTEPKELAYDAVRASPQPAATSGIGLPAQIDARNYIGAPTLTVDPYLRFINANSTYSYLVQAPAAGTYYLSVSAAASTSGGILNVLVNGVAAGSLSVPDNGDDNTFVDTLQLPMSLQSGQNVIELSVPTNRPYNIDSLKITDASQTSLGDTLPMIGALYFYYQQTVPIDGSFSTGFTVNDATINPNSLAISVTSDNPTLVPNNSANLVVSGSGRSRTLTVIPAAGQSGTANITLTVSDGQLSRSVLFTRLTVGTSSPTNLVATAVGPSQIDLNWSDNGQNETGYVLQVATSSNMAGATSYSLPGGSSSYSVPGLNSSQTYYFSVYTTSSGGNSPTSNIASATTATLSLSAPTNLAAMTASPGQINLSWVDDNVTSGFQIDVASDSGFANTIETLTASAGASSFQVAGLAANTTYYFRVRAVNSVIVSPNSSSATNATLSEPSVSLANATQSVNENGGTFTVTVNLSAASGVATTVPFTLGGSAVSGVNYSGVTSSPITIPAGQTSATISGTLIDDGKYEPNNTTLTVTLGTPTNATLGTTTSDTLTINQSDPEPSVALANATQSVNENDGTFTVTVNLSAVSGVATTVPFTLGGSAVSGVNYSGVTSSPITIPAGQTSATISGTLIDDGLYGPNSVLSVTLGTPTNAVRGSITSESVTIVQLPPPISKVNSLATRQSALSFPVTVTGSDPAPGPGVASYDIYAATNGGPFTFWTNVPAASPTALFSGQSNTTYTFHSIAHDLSGNVELKSATLIEASTYVPDFTPPVTHITPTVTSPTNGTFSIAYSGTAPGGSGISSFTVSVKVDSGAVQTIGQFPAGTPTSGVYSGQTTYQGLQDGSSHSYAFYIQATNGNGVQSTPQAATPLPETFSAPIIPQVTAFSVENGLSERSYIRYLNVTFNEPVSSLILNTSTVKLEQFALDGVTPVGYINLTGKITLVDHVMAIDFGAGGIGGSENLANTLGNYTALTADDGYYKLLINPDNTGNHLATESFYRLLGDVIGNAAGGPTTTGATVNGNVIGMLSNNDLNAIAAAVGQTATAQNQLLNNDINGAGSVTANDRVLAAKSLAAGRRLAAGLYLSD